MTERLSRTKEVRSVNSGLVIRELDSDSDYKIVRSEIGLNSEETESLREFLNDD